MLAGDDLNSKEKIFPRVALIGCGVMGTAIGHRLSALGYPLNVYNRTCAKTDTLVKLGATAKQTPQQAAQYADIVLTVVTDDVALNAVLLEPQGVLNNDYTVPLVIDFGTHNPIALSEIAYKVKEHKTLFVEAPLTGSVHDATQGTLSFLVGAEENALSLAKPFLEKLGQTVFHFGLPGSGSIAKLAMNLLIGAMTQGLSEAIAMLNAAHLNIADFLKALNNSGLSSPLYNLIGQRYLENDFAARFSLANLERDVTLARQHAHTLSINSLIASTLAKSFKAIDTQYKNLDYSALIALQSGRHQCVTSH